MYIYLASADGTFNVAKGGHEWMPGGSWSVHLLVSFEVATCGGRRKFLGNWKVVEAKLGRQNVEPTLEMFLHPLWSLKVFRLFPL